MSYFNPAFLNFFKELSRNNTISWFNENRKTYEKEVKKPFSEFVEEMISRIQKYEPEVEIKPADAIMRINKDIRFSKDKTSYHTYMAANISVCGKKDKSYPGFYFQLSPDGVKMYGGVFMVDTTRLQSIRNHIAANLKEFSEVYSDKEFREKFGNIQGEQNKRLPAEFQEAAEKESLIANKQYYYSTSLNPGIITSPELPEQLMEYYLAGKGVNDFLKVAWKN